MNTSPEKTGCTLCPRACGVRRDEHPAGFCGMGCQPVVSRAAPHFWEEPCISGQKGSGAVFFAGCNLRCVFCQNYAISAQRQGQAVSVAHLRQIFARLAQQGVHNINLVTGAHFVPVLLEALEPPLPLPVVWNSSGYESVETLRRLEGKVQIYLPDMKYGQRDLAKQLSAAEDYPAVAQAAILEMFRQVGPYQLDEEGMMTRGVIIRHLVLPGYLDNTFDVLDWIAETFRPGDVMVSLLGQYTPNGHGGPTRRLTAQEYQRAVDYMEALGILEGFTQDLDSAEECYTPAFDGTGV
jgi:putative pyruvate formate lyase activating enzyme